MAMTSIGVQVEQIDVKPTISEKSIVIFWKTDTTSGVSYGKMYKSNKLTTKRENQNNQIYLALKMIKKQWVGRKA